MTCGKTRPCMSDHRVGPREVLLTVSRVIPFFDHEVHSSGYLTRVFRLRVGQRHVSNGLMVTGHESIVSRVDGSLVSYRLCPSPSLAFFPSVSSCRLFAWFCWSFFRPIPVLPLFLPTASWSWWVRNKSNSGGSNPDGHALNKPFGIVRRRLMLMIFRGEENEQVIDCNNNWSCFPFGSFSDMTWSCWWLHVLHSTLSSWSISH